MFLGLYLRTFCLAQNLLYFLLNILVLHFWISLSSKYLFISLETFILTHGLLQPMALNPQISEYLENLQIHFCFISSLLWLWLENIPYIFKYVSSFVLRPTIRSFLNKWFTWEKMCILLLLDRVLGNYDLGQAGRRCWVFCTLLILRILVQLIAEGRVVVSEYICGHVYFSLHFYPFLFHASWSSIRWVPI